MLINKATLDLQPSKKCQVSSNIPIQPHSAQGYSRGSGERLTSDLSLHLQGRCVFPNPLLRQAQQLPRSLFYIPYHQSKHSHQMGQNPTELTNKYTCRSSLRDFSFFNRYCRRSEKTPKMIKSNHQLIPTHSIIQVGEDFQDHQVQLLIHPHHAHSQSTRVGKGFQVQAQPQPIPACPLTVGPPPPSWAAVSVHHHSFGEEVSSNNQPDPLPAQCEAITSCPIAATWEQRMTPTSAHPPFGEL